MDFLKIGERLKERLGLRLQKSVDSALFGNGSQCSDGLKQRVADLSSIFAQSYSFKADNFGRQSLSTLFHQAFDERLVEISAILFDLDYPSFDKQPGLVFDVRDWGEPDEDISIHNFSEALLNASTFIDENDQISQAAKLGLEHNELKIASQDLELIRHVFQVVAKTFVGEEVRFCQYCFRRIETRKACPKHLSSDSNKDRNRANQLAGKVIHPEALELLNRYRSQRRFLGDDVVVRDFEHDRDSQINILRSVVHVDFSTDMLINRIVLDPWNDAVNDVRSFIANYCANIFTLIPDKAYEVESFQAFVGVVYGRNILDNRYDSCVNPYWFLRTLKIAEIWYVAEGLVETDLDGRTKDTSARDKRIIDLVNIDKKSYQTAANIETESYEEISKSMVAKIMKNWRLSQKSS